MRRPWIAVLAAAVLTACIPAVPATAMAQAKPGQALVRVAHFSPDASYVDVYMVSLNRKQLFPNVFYKSVSAYWPVAAGPFTYEVRAAGAEPESQPVIQVKGNLAAGKAYTVAAVGRRDQLQGLLLRDDMASSAPGKAKVRFLDAAFGLPTVDIAVAGGPVLESRLAYPEPTGYRQLASGSYRVEVRRAGADAVLVKGTVAVKPGTVTSVALLGGAGERRELYAFSDAAGSRSAPAGGIRTGAGGTAPSSLGPNTPVPPFAAALPLVLPAAALVALVVAGPSGGAFRASAVPPRSRPRRAALAAVAAAVAVALGGCAGTVDNQEHPNPASATLPHRGPEQPRVGLRHAPGPEQPGVGLRHAPGPEQPEAGLPHAREPGVGSTHDPKAGPAAGSFDMPGAAPANGRFDVPGTPPEPPGFEVGELPEQPTASGPASPPVRLVIPAIGVATPLVRLGLEPDGGMAVPSDFGRAGWFAEGPAPGQVGPSVIAGHVDSQTGPAVFYRLRELRPGDQVRVVRADGSRLRFVVEGARSYPKDAFPTDAVFGPVPGAALRLITCAGDFDRARGSYRDNLVVFARLAGTG